MNTIDSSSKLKESMFQLNLPQTATLVAKTAINSEVPSDVTRLASIMDENLFSLLPKIQSMKNEIVQLKKFCEGLEAKFLLSHEPSIDS